MAATLAQSKTGIDTNLWQAFPMNFSRRLWESPSDFSALKIERDERAAFTPAKFDLRIPRYADQFLFAFASSCFLSFSRCVTNSASVANPMKKKQSISNVRFVGLRPVQRLINMHAMIAQ
jgi:hypothetical protein